MHNIVDIKPAHDLMCDCYEDTIVTVMKWKGIDYRLIFAEAWRFEFNTEDSEEKLIGDRVKVENELIDDTLEKYYHIKLKLHLNLSLEYYIHLISEEIQANRPIVIAGDAYYIPWDRSYLKTHIGHFFIIKGIDDEKRQLDCIDPYLEKDEILLFYEELARICVAGYEGNKGNNIGCITFVGLEDEYKHITCINVLEDVVKRTRYNEPGEGVIGELKQFKKYIENKLNLQVEFAGNDEIWWQPQLANKLFEVYNSRNKIKGLVECLAIYYDSDSLRHLEKEFDQLIYNWEHFKNMLIRCYLVKDYKCQKNKARISGIIEEIINMEKQLIEEMATIIKNKDIYASKQSTIPMIKMVEEQREEVEILDISSLRNARAFNNIEKNDLTVDFNGEKMSLSPEFFKISRILTFDEMEVNMIEMILDKYDHVRCQGQEIKISPNNYSSIKFLSCATNGDAKGKVVFKYIDGEREVIDLEVSDWHSLIPKEREKIVWQGPILQSKQGKLEKILQPGTLFVQYYDLNEKKRLESIILPKSEEIHIFSILFFKKF